MASVNKVIVVGNLGRDPESRTFPNGDAVCNFSIATTRKWKDKASSEMKEETEWHRISAFGRVAEIAAQYLRKGSACYVDGRLKTRKWADKDGVEKYTTEIVCESLQLLGGRGEQDAAPAPPARRAAPAPASGGGFDDMEDDIPF